VVVPAVLRALASEAPFVLTELTSAPVPPVTLQVKMVSLATGRQVFDRLPFYIRGLRRLELGRDGLAGCPKHRQQQAGEARLRVRPDAERTELVTVAMLERAVAALGDHRRFDGRSDFQLASMCLAEHHSGLAGFRDNHRPRSGGT
jgi:hypothetical protein